jgi:hypothetical protein
MVVTSLMDSTDETEILSSCTKGKRQRNNLRLVGLQWRRHMTGYADEVGRRNLVATNPIAYCEIAR